jgi:hypothetical protein
VGEKSAFLDDIPHLPAHEQHGFGCYALAVESDRPMICWKETYDQAENGRFTASAGAEQDGCPPDVNGQAKRPDGGELIEGLGYVV